jgi:hypothetical protein
MRTNTRRQARGDISQDERIEITDPRPRPPKLHHTRGLTPSKALCDNPVGLGAM